MRIAIPSICAAHLLLAACTQSALLVSEISPLDQRVEGQVFCLAKGVVPLVAKRTAAKKNGENGAASLGDLPILPTAAVDKPKGGEPSKGGDKAAEDGQGQDGQKPKTGSISGGATTAITEFGITIEIGAVRYVPDCQHSAYTVQLDHHVFHDDDVAIEIDPQTKLLKGVNSTLTDKTPEIIKTVANAPLRILNGTPMVAALDGVQVKEFAFVHDLDPTDPKSVRIVNDHLGAINAKMRLYAGPLIKIPHTSDKPARCKSDLCFRTAIPYVIELRTEAAEGESFVLAQRIVVVPNRFVVASVPVTRAPFVSKKVVLEFTDGMLTKSQIVNPSEVLAGIQIPIEVAKAIVSIPSAMLKFQVTQIQGNNSLLTAQKENLALQRQIIEAQQALLAAAAQHPTEVGTIQR